MKKIVILILLGCMMVGFGACQKTSQNDTTETSSNREATHIGDAVLREPVREASDKIYSDTGITKTDQYGVYTKQMTVYGITFIAQEEIPDEYLLNIAKTTKEIFAVTETTDTKLQEEVLQNMYKYKALIPVVQSEAKMADPSSFLSTNSVCDIIMYESHVRAMEVVEHILHTATDVGLHYADTKNFGLNQESTAYQIMQEAITNKQFNIGDYEEIPEPVKNRILIQEFMYWGITSVWNIQENYGTGEREWTLQDSEKIKESLPAFHQLYETTISTIMTAPSTEQLNTLK